MAPSEEVMSSALRRCLLCLAGLSLGGGCAGVPTTVSSYKLPMPPRGIVLVVDGAGGFQDAPKSLAAAVEAARLPLFVRSYDWTHGRGQGLVDVQTWPIRGSKLVGSPKKSAATAQVARHPDLCGCSQCRLHGGPHRRRLAAAGQHRTHDLAGAGRRGRFRPAAGLSPCCARGWNAFTSQRDELLARFRHCGGWHGRRQIRQARGRPGRL